jgi:hypothetical protein
LECRRFCRRIQSLPHSAKKSACPFSAKIFAKIPQKIEKKNPRKKIPQTRFPGQLKEWKYHPMGHDENVQAGCTVVLAKNAVGDVLDLKYAIPEEMSFMTCHSILDYY